MANKTRRQSYRSAGRTRGRGGNAKPGGFLNQITSQLGRSGGGGGRGANKGGGLASKATGFVSGFLSGGGKSGRRRR